MSNQDDFFEVTNEVPFKPIKQIKVESVQVKEEQIIVRASMTLEGGPDGQFIDLVRTEKDIAWLLENLGNSGQIPLLPRIDYENTFSQLYNLISGAQPARVKKLRLLKQKIFLRCLNIVSSICLEHIRMVDVGYQMPIFIFFHQNFSLYQNPIYFKQQKKALTQKVGNYFWQKYALFTGKGNSWDKLQASKTQLFQQRQRVGQVTSKLQQYLTHLIKLQDEFMSQKDRIRKRAISTQQLYLSFQMQLRYLDLIIEEAKETAARAEQQKMQNQKLIMMYSQQLGVQAKQAVKTSQTLLSQYVKVICQAEEKLRIAPH